MKNWKPTVSLGVCLVMLMSLAGCGGTAMVTEEEMTADYEAVVQGEETKEESLEGVHVFMFKSSDSPFGTLMYEGFEEYMAAHDRKASYQSPKEPTAQAQVQMLDELIDQKVASITISANSGEGYEDVLKRAKESGIPVISVDSEVGPEQTVCHVEQALATDVGAHLIQLAVLITLQEEYPGDEVLEETVQRKLEEYSGKELVFGVLSSTEDSPAQNEWIEAMKAELQKEYYSGKVSAELDIKYGNDASADSKVQVGAFMREELVDCIIAPTTVGITAAAEVLTDNSSEIGLTGLGLPSLMQSYMPVKETDNTFGYACPYMLLWDVTHLGATAAAATYAAVYNGFTGEAGEVFDMDAFGDYAVTTYESYTSGEGTGILAGVPIVFHKGNMEEWKDVL